KRKQKDSKGLHKFVVFNHLFSSHTANLISSVRKIKNEEIAGEPIKNLKRVLTKLEKLIKAYKVDKDDEPFEAINIQIPNNLLIDLKDSDEKKFINGQVLELRKVSDDLQKSSEAVLGDKLEKQSLLKDAT